MEDEVQIVEENGQMEARVVSKSLPDTEQIAPLMGFFDIEGRVGVRQAEKLKDIWDFLGDEVKESGLKNEIAPRLMALKKIESKLGTPAMNQSRVDQIRKYVQLERAVREAEKERDQLTR